MLKEAEHGDHALHPSTGEAEAFESLSSQPDWSTEFEASQGPTMGPCLKEKVARLLKC